MQQLAFDAIESVRDFGFKPSVYRELSIGSGSLERDSEVLPILSKLSHRPDERWLTCVNTPLLAKEVARDADIRSRSVLRVRSSENLDTAEVIMKALRSGQSHTVIGFCGEMTSAKREELRLCAEREDCNCLVLTQG